MAHADYACCAICAQKLWYDEEQENHKTEICDECMEALAREGHTIEDVEGLLEWLEAAEPADRERVLSAVKYEACPYENDVDDTIERLRTFRPEHTEQPSLTRYDVCTCLQFDRCEYCGKSRMHYDALMTEVERARTTIRQLWKALGNKPPEEEVSDDRP